MGNKTSAMEIADFALNTRNESIPGAAYGAAKKLIIDTLGVAIAGHASPGIPESISQMREWGGKPEAGLFISGERIPAPNAVFSNSAMAHALDFDSVHKPSGLHSMVSLLPTAIAASEMSGVSGRDFLAALILGEEVACRIGRVYSKVRSGGNAGYLRGFLPSSVVGGFGCVAALGRIFGMSEEQTASAMGINYAQAAGNRQALFDRTLTKRLQPAFAARSAWWSAALARKGISGPANILEGKAGLFTVYRNSAPPPLDELLEPRDCFEIQCESVKRYPVCGQAIADAGVRLGKNIGFSLDEIESVEIFMGENGLTAGDFKMSGNLQVNAQFTSKYAAALGLLRGKIGLREISDEQIKNDSEAAELAAMIKINPDKTGVPPAKIPAAGKFYGWDSFSNKGIKVALKNGRNHECFRADFEAFGPESMSVDDVIAKFYLCAEFSGICPRRRASSIISAIMDLESSPGTGRLADNMNLSGFYAAGRRGFFA